MSGIVLAITFLAIYRQLRLARNAGAIEYCSERPAWTVTMALAPPPMTVQHQVSGWPRQRTIANEGAPGSARQIGASGEPAVPTAASDCRPGPDRCARGIRRAPSIRIARHRRVRRRCRSGTGICRCLRRLTPRSCRGHLPCRTRGSIWWPAATSTRGWCDWAWPGAAGRPSGSCSTWAVAVDAPARPRWRSIDRGAGASFPSATGQTRAGA